MDNKQARQILEARIPRTGEFSKDKLSCVGWYLYAGAGHDEATLDGEFSAAELEAIAAWMRDPEGVANA